MVRHPAVYSDVLMPYFIELAKGHNRLLDPFAGTGKIGLIKEHVDIEVHANELEREWLSDNRYGCDRLFYQDAEFLDTGMLYDIIITSPTYGNRMADHFKASNPNGRFTYTHCLGRDLTEGNTGVMHFGKDYCDKHMSIFKHLYNIMIDNGVFVLNCSDFIKKGEIIPVTGWMKDTMGVAGFGFVKDIEVQTPRMRFGANGSVRVPCEHILVFRK